MVRKQEAKEVATKSVGEKCSPEPLLSLGASVTIFSPEEWVASVRSLPE
jgi:hypothetical protein